MDEVPFVYNFMRKFTVYIITTLRTSLVIMIVAVMVIKAV